MMWIIAVLILFLSEAWSLEPGLYFHTFYSDVGMFWKFLFFVLVRYSSYTNFFRAAKTLKKITL